MELLQKRNLIQQEETAPNAGLTQAMLSRVGETLNLISYQQVTGHDFKLNGQYNAVALPFELGDGYVSYPWPWELVEIQVFTGKQQGSSGLTELDFLWKPQIGGAWATICSTTPKVDFSAAARAQMSLSYAPAGMTSPVLSKTQFAAYDAIRCDILQVQSGSPNGIFAKLYARPIGS